MSRGRAPGHEGAHAGFEPVQGLIQDGARAGDVHAGEAPTAGAEDRAVVEPQPGLAQDEVVELVRPQSRGREQTGAVQPQQVGALAGRGRDAGHRLQALDDVLTGRRDVLAQLVEPGVAVLVGGAAGDQPQGVGLGVAASVELGAEAGAQRGVGDEDVGRLQSGEVECLGRRGARDRAGGDLRAQ